MTVVIEATTALTSTGTQVLTAAGLRDIQLQLEAGFGVEELTEVKGLSMEVKDVPTDQ